MVCVYPAKLLISSLITLQRRKKKKIIATWIILLPQINLLKRFGETSIFVSNFVY